MDSMISAAARALAAGDPLGALKRVALRGDPAALALRGLAMAQMGNLGRARELLREGAKAFAPGDAAAAARCQVAEAEIALVSRDLSSVGIKLEAARALLEARGDALNAAHATHLEARRYLLLGQVDEAESTLRKVAPARLPPMLRAVHELIVAGIWLRRIRTGPARTALAHAVFAATQAGIPSLTAEVERSASLLHLPAAQLVSGGKERVIRLEEVETVLASSALVIDLFGRTVRLRKRQVDLRTRPVLLALARALAEASPRDVSRHELLKRVFGARIADDSHRVRLRVEAARLRAALEGMASLTATRKGFVLLPHEATQVAVLAPLGDGEYGEVLALLADGEAWSSSALALALGSSTRTVQRALEVLAADGKVHSFGRGPAKRWVTAGAPGFPTVLLLPAAPGVHG